MLLEDRTTHCPIHSQPLDDGYVLVSYGLFRFSEKYYEARENLFPMSKFFVLGGCVVGDEAIYRVKYCSACRRANLLWAHENQSSEGLPPTQEQAEQILHLRFGMQTSVRSVPPEVHELLRANQLVAAVKLLQRANPGIEIGELRAHLRYLNRGAELEQARLALRSSGPHLAYAELEQAPK